MILFICEPPGFWDEPKKVNVKITTVNDFDADGKPRQIVTVETVDPDKEKREAKQKLRAMREQQLKERFEKIGVWDYIRFTLAIILIISMFVIALYHTKPY